MAISIDNVVGLHEQAVKLRSKRTELIAANIANADTPGYKARDFDFQKALSDARAGSASSPSRMEQTHAGHMSGEGSMGFELMYTNPLQPSVDDNTVDLHREKAKFTENAMQHQASLTFLDRKFKGLVSALRGE